MNKPLFMRGLKAGIPIALGYFSVSIAFGLQAVAPDCGLHPLQALLISLTNLTSAGQLAGIQVIAASGTLFEMGLTQLTINLRYALMSLILTQKLDGSMGTLQRLIFSFGNTDEIFAVAASEPGTLNKHYLYGLMTLPYLGWGLGTLVGAVAGMLLPAFVQTALGIALYGMFLAVVLPASRKERPVCVVAIIAALLSIAFRYIPFLRDVPGGYVIIICAVAASCAGAALFPVKDEDGKEGA